MFALLLPLIIMSDPVPIAGRPVDFSGAVGGPFVVTMAVDKTEVKLDEPIKLTITITGPGDLSKVKRPDLKNDPEWTANLIVDEGTTTIIESGVEFGYLIRPIESERSRRLRFSSRGLFSESFDLPRFRLVYFNPKHQTSNKGWQTTYSEQLKITIFGQESPPIPNPVVQEWSNRVGTDRRTFEDYSWRQPIRWFLERGGCRNGLGPPLLQATWTLKQNDLSSAVYLLNQVVRTHPDNGLAWEGLDIARSMALQNTDQSAQQLLVSPSFRWPYWMFKDWICIFGVTAWIGIAVTFACSIKYGGRKWIWAIIAFGPIAAVPIINSLVLKARTTDDQKSPPIVFTRKAELRAGNGSEYPLKADVPIGVEARVVGQRDRWAQVEFTSGQIGWVTSNSFSHITQQPHAP